VQDPLFKAGVHPLRRINTLSDDEVAALWRVIREMLQESIDHGGSAWELNLYGEKGGWGELMRCCLPLTIRRSVAWRLHILRQPPSGVAPPLSSIRT
jgi:hypothetical protein